jgi:26S proteasome regulatory subunit T1
MYYFLSSNDCYVNIGAELRSVCTEAGMFAIRARRKSVSEKDFLDSINKVCMYVCMYATG